VDSDLQSPKDRVGQFSVLKDWSNYVPDVRKMRPALEHKAGRLVRYNDGSR